jgi:osmotically-inducible protein OsmY
MGDEGRPWFGDDDARALRGNDEREDPYRYGGERDRAWQDQGDGSYDRGWRAGRGDRADGRDDRGYGDRGYFDRGGADRGYGDRSYGPESGGFARGEQFGSPSYERFSHGRDERGNGYSRGERFQGEDSGRPSFSSNPSGGSRSGWGGQDYGASSAGTGAGWGASRGDVANRESYAGRGPKGYKRSDERIREELSDRLMDDDNVDATEITVQVQGGEVTLTGTVPGRSHKRRAEDLAESVSGVSEVINNLRVSRQDTAMSTPSAHGGTAMPKGGRGPSTNPA